MRADPGVVKESWIRAEIVNQRDAEFVYGPTEELVSNVVRLNPINEGEALPVSVDIVIW